jgi:hypothetical protein
MLRDELRRNLLFGKKLGMNANDQRFFVVAAIEDADVSAIRSALQATPKVIVIEIFGRGRLERVSLAALGIDAGHDVLDGAILAGGVHGLKNQQDGPFVLGVEHVLQFGQGLDTDL